MNDKEAVLMVEPQACIEKIGLSYVFRKSPGGPAILSRTTPGRAWKAARMRLFHEGIMEIISSVPVVEK